ncbi:MAG TPA: FAD-dependent oxidoreductase, partial [Candidatus Baltobacteraceae bacterium]|nr:FAD-dependent oxidoreductase [Candidatus Baltobacteraceae bacterium]
MYLPRDGPPRSREPTGDAAAAPPRRLTPAIAGPGPADLAGLVAAYELKRQGHHVTVLEAQNRVGGRAHTMRGFAPGLYAEAGAMRIPRAHDLTLEYHEGPEWQVEHPALQPAIVQPEGRVLFAGEHCSLYHAWIQGA